MGRFFLLYKTTPNELRVDCRQAESNDRARVLFVNDDDQVTLR